MLVDDIWGQSLMVSDQMYKSFVVLVDAVWFHAVGLALGKCRLVVRWLDMELKHSLLLNNLGVDELTCLKKYFK